MSNKNIISVVESKLKSYYQTSLLRDFSDCSTIRFLCTKCNYTDYVRANPLIRWLFQLHTVTGQNNRLSFVYNNQPIVLYFTSKYLEEYSKFYYEYSCWGVYLSVLAMNAGTILTKQGLLIKEIEEISPLVISKYLDIDYCQYLAGFNSAKDILQMFERSKYYKQ